MYTNTKTPVTPGTGDNAASSKKGITATALPAVPAFQQAQFVLQKKTNNTGLPANLKTGIENLSGLSMDDVKVHYNSGKPAQLNALAYAQGTDIHIAPGQEKHLPHEAWHVVQQKQGRVKATRQMKGISVNDDQGLEKEADTMGHKAFQLKNINDARELNQPQTNNPSNKPMQLIKNLSPGTLVEVRPGAATWEGYINKVLQGGNYEIVHGANAKGYGTEDKSAKEIVHEAQVFLHANVKPKLGINHDNELNPKEIALLKGRGYKKLTKRSVQQGWSNISDDQRSDWDQKFKDEYSQNLELIGLTKEDLTFSKDMNKMLRQEITIDEAWNKHENTLTLLGYTTKQMFTQNSLQKQQTPPANDDNVYDNDENFKLGWKGTVVENARKREAGQPHGEYTGSYNLQAGWLKAEGSYRSGDPLQQNEIIYQIWKAIHEKKELDMNNPDERRPLKKITRNHVVNKESQPILGPLKGGIYNEGTKEFDTLLSTPNIRAALFLVKDRGKELGISGISMIELPGVDAVIHFRS
jgi:hypothetical protein